VATKPIVISIQGDDSNLKKALKNATKSVEGFGKKMGTLGLKAGAAFAGTAAAIGVKGVGAFGDFEKSMNEVMTLLPDAGEGAFDELSGQVKDFAKEFGVLPSQSIPALYQALSAGVPRDNVFEFMETAQQAAKGGVTDLETAVDGISSVMNAYGDQVSGATEVSDLMFTAVRLGKTTFEEMSASMFQVAPIAASLGVPFQDVTTSIANLTAMGVPTSVASTQMKAALAELGKEGTKADEAFRELTGMGLTQFLEEEGNFASAIGIMAEGADEAGISVLDMFGSIEAGQAVLALTQGGTEDYMETLGQMSESAGATEAAFDTMDTGLAAGFDRIKANLNVLAIEIGEKIAPYIETATGWILRAFENLGPAVVAAKDFVVDLGTEIADRAVPILGSIRDVLEVVAEKVMDAYRAVDQYLRPGITAAKDAVVALIDEGVNRLISLFNAIDWGAVGATLGEAFITARDAVLDFVRGIPDAFRETIDWIKRNKDWLIVLGGVIGGLVVGWYAYKAALVVVTAAQAILTAATGAWAAILAVLASPVVLIVAAIAALVGGLVAAYFQFEEVRNVIDALAGFLQDYVLPIFTAVWDSIVAQFFNVWTVISNFVELVSAIFSGDWNDALHHMGEIARGVLDFIVEAFIGLPLRLLEGLAPLGGKLLDWAGSAMGALWDGLKEHWDDILIWWMGMPLRIFNVIGQGLSLLVNAGKDLIGSLLDGMVEGLSSAVGWVADFAAGLVRAIISFFNEKVIDTINDAIPDKIEIPFAPDVNLPDNPLPRIPNLARGGVAVGSTLARIGEAGEPEAIVPLSRANEFGFGGGNTINLTVNAGMGTDPVMVGREIISVLKQWERHNGSIPLTTSAA
tara:strand:- start:8077 stop:10653 length:2577 start_codon:yes stop_codon:yes gene_type:complete